MACVEGAFGQCINGKWQTTDCAGGNQCFALPLVNSVGTVSIRTVWSNLTKVNRISVCY